MSSRSVQLKWQPRGGDAAEVTKYIVEYMELERSWHHIEISDPPQYTTLIENLKPATRYAFRIIAEGPAGQSAPSQELIIRTEPQRPAGPPLSVNARPLSSTEILVTWMPPLAELRHGEIQGYNIGYKSSLSQSSGYNFTSVSGDGEGGTGDLLLTGLSKYTRYTLVAQAFNQIGPGPLSEAATAQTLEDGKYMRYFLFNTISNVFFHLCFSSEYATGRYSLRSLNVAVIASFMAVTAGTSYKWSVARVQIKFRAAHG